MPKFNQNPFNPNARQTFAPPTESQMESIPAVPLINPLTEMRQHINFSQMNQHQRKIPPPPPPRRAIYRTDPEGMQQTPSIAEDKKNFQMAEIQQTNIPRIPPKPFINLGHQQQHNLLNQTPTSNQFVFAKALNVNSNNCNSNDITNLHHQLQFPPKFTHFPTIRHHSNSNQMFHKPRTQQLVHKQMPHVMTRVMKEYAESRAEKSDPENHIYEMIDEYEVKSNFFQVPNHPNHPTIADETKASSNLFKNLLRAEMMNQIQSCSKMGNNGYLSHLPQQKRMDIIQETALSLASAAYLEK